MAKESKTEFGGNLSRIVNAAALRRERLPQELLATESVKSIAWTEGVAALERLNTAIAAGGEYPDWFADLVEANAAEADAERKAQAAPIAGAAQ